jgi:hypothetical protein
MGIAKRFVLSIFGMILVLAWWTIRGPGEGASSSEGIPAKVWKGGAGVVTIEIENTDAGSLTFETNKAIDDPDHKLLETWQKIEPGHHTFRVDVPANVGGSVEFTADKPKVGSKVSVRVGVDGREVASDSLTMDEPLKPGWAFGAQVQLADYATGAIEGE